MDTRTVSVRVCVYGYVYMCFNPATSQVCERVCMRVRTRMRARARARVRVRACVCACA